MKYDFIEIGTSNFDTLIQSVYDKNHDVKGLSIDPVKEYIDMLPDVEGVEKLNIAISNFVGFISVWYIPPDVIEEYNLSWIVKGCNSVLVPHPTIIKKLGKELYYKLAECDNIETWNWDKLITIKNITSINYLKIDTEGHDITIMNDYINECEKNNQLYADKIRFETNVLSSETEITNLLNRIKEMYSIQRLSDDTILTKKG